MRKSSVTYKNIPVSATAIDFTLGATMCIDDAMCHARVNRTQKSVGPGVVTVATKYNESDPAS